MVFFPPLMLFHSPLSEALVARNRGCTPFSEVEHHEISNSIPLTSWFVDMSSGTTYSQPGPRYDQHLCGKPLGICFDVYGIRNTVFFISWCCPNVIIHGHEDDPSLKLLRFTLYFRHHVLNLRWNSQCGESWEIFPLEFHRLSINSIHFFEMTCLQVPLNFVFPGLNWFSTDASPNIAPSQKTRKFCEPIYHTVEIFLRRLIPINRGQTCDLRQIFDQLLSCPK